MYGSLKKICISTQSYLDLQFDEYNKTLNIRDVKFSRDYENDKLAHFNFGVGDIPWLKIVKTI